jgi:vacuolar-type H+-ATPase subunit F/Vma7
VAGVAVIGERVRVQGWALAGVRVLSADGADETRQAWHSLGAEVVVVLLTSSAAEYLADELVQCSWPFPVVIPL